MLRVPLAKVPLLQLIAGAMVVPVVATRLGPLPLKVLANTMRGTVQLCVSTGDPLQPAGSLVITERVCVLFTQVLQVL